MLFSFGRSATRRLASTALTASSTSSVVYRATTFKAPGIYGYFPHTIRGFAAAGRPKKVSASEGAKKTPAKKPVKKPVKKPATKSTQKTKAKAKPKPKLKPKPKTKTKPKTKPGPKPKKVISEKQKGILERRKLKEAALFSEPKLLPGQPWLVFVTERTQGTKPGNMTAQMAALSQDYKALSSSELQRIKSKAEQNKAANEVAYKAWVETHLPQNTYDANTARRALKKKYNIPKAALKLIRDERLPKKAPTSFTLFNQARWASGELQPGSATENSARIGQEWKSLTAAARKPYEDRARVELDNYHKVLNTMVTRKRAKTTTTTKTTKSPSP